MNQNKRTFFIVFEGGEGVGKSSQIKLLENVLIKNNMSYFKTREPGGTENAEKIRNLIFDNEFDEITDLLLYIGARHENILHTITPNCGKYDFILCDRFVLSTLVYQGIVGKFPIDMLLKLHEVVNFDLYPDLTFIIDADIEMSYPRLLDRHINANKLDRKPKEWHVAVNLAFKKYKDFYKGRTALINGSLNIMKVHKQIVTSINNNFNLDLKI